MILNDDGLIKKGFKNVSDLTDKHKSHINMMLTIEYLFKVSIDGRLKIYNKLQTLTDVIDIRFTCNDIIIKLKETENIGNSRDIQNVKSYIRDILINERV